MKHKETKMMKTNKMKCQYKNKWTKQKKCIRHKQNEITYVENNNKKTNTKHTPQKTHKKKQNKIKHVNKINKINWIKPR